MRVGFDSVSSTLIAVADKRPWHKLKGETARAFQAFQVYLELGSLVEVDATLYGKRQKRKGQAAKRKTPNGNVTDWSRKYNWVVRREAYLDHLAGKRMESAEREQERTGINWAHRLEQLDRRQLELIEKAQDRLEAMPDHPIEKVTDSVIEHYPDGRAKIIRRNVEPSRWSMASVASLINAVRDHSRDIAERRRGGRYYPSERLIDEQECEALLLKLREDAAQSHRVNANSAIEPRRGVRPARTAS